MDLALDFLNDHFRNGLCYPVWVEEYQNELVTKNAPKSKSTTCMDLDQCLLTCDTESQETLRHNGKRSRKGFRRTNSFVPTLESRDPCSENILLSSLREGEGTDDIIDLDDVITKIVRKRDELLKDKVVADEEIKRLRLENENLKNLNSISKRINKSQRDELVKLKMDSITDKREIQDLKNVIEQLLMRTNDSKCALDGSDFLGGISTCDGGQTPMNGVSKNVPAKPGMLDSILGWNDSDKR